MSILKRVQTIISARSKFLQLWLAQIFTQSAVSMVTIIISILSHEGVLSPGTKESATGIGIIINLSTLPGLVVAPIAGVFADWFEKKRIMIFSNLIRFVFLFVYILFLGWNYSWASYLLVFFLSMVLQFFIPAEGGLIPRLVSKKHILLANSLFSLTVYSTLGIAVALSGLVLSLFGVKFTFLACGVLFIISTILLLNINIKSDKENAKSVKYLIFFIKDLFRDVKEGVIYAFGKKIIRFALIHLMMLQIVALTLVTIVYRIGSEIYGVSPRSAGLVVFAPIILGLVVGIALLNIMGRRINRVVLVWYGTVYSIIGFGFMAIISSVDGVLSRLLLDDVVATVSLLAIGLSIPYLLIPSQTMIYENTKADFRGRILGIWLALTSSLAALVATFIGYIVDKLGDISAAIYMIVIADILYSIIILLLLKKREL